MVYQIVTQPSHYWFFLPVHEKLTKVLIYLVASNITSAILVVKAIVIVSVLRNSQAGDSYLAFLSLLGICKFSIVLRNSRVGDFSALNHLRMTRQKIDSCQHCIGKYLAECPVI